ncbi:unnamed protein product [Meloidogyne enterolobii]|uniref:Uncharacterized protein n=1 Tax=Meloidogyne enterolobii TaxID=390850 RepID=A0ACB0Y6U5_MELEN
MILIIWELFKYAFFMIISRIHSVSCTFNPCMIYSLFMLFLPRYKAKHLLGDISKPFNSVHFSSILKALFSCSLSMPFL